MRSRKILGCVIIIVGLVVAVYPLCKAFRYDYASDRLIAQWTAAEQPGVPAALDPVSRTVNEPDYAPARYADTGEAADFLSEATEPVSMAGILRITKIKLQKPILIGVNEYNLNRGACVVDGSPGMGEEGNYCLAGHRSRIYGRHFNRLAELENGDTVTLDNGSEIYTFYVRELILVTPDDTWVMSDTPGKTELTLITCDYTTPEKGRLIVRCELAVSPVL